MVDIYKDQNNFITGYVRTDVKYDNFVDVSNVILPIIIR